MASRFSLIAEFIEGLRIAIAAIGANKMRSLLTTLGVVIGVTFVVLMGWFLEGLDAAWDQTISTLGYEVIYVSKYDWTGRTPWREARKRPNITIWQINQAITKLTAVEFAYPTVMQWGATVRTTRHSVRGVSIVGTTSDNQWELAPTIERGRFFSPAEDRITSYVTVLGYNVWQELFPNQDPIGQFVYYRGRKFRVIGILSKRGTLISEWGDNQIYLPLQVFRQLHNERNLTYTLVVKAPSEAALPDVIEEARLVMRQVRKLSPGEPDNFSINTANAFEQQVRTIRLTIWGVGIGMTGLSFLVGIIGIMNIMFVSVIERTREIGIRKAVGAKRRSIILQFLIEAAMLSSLGALIALVLCSVIIIAAKYWLFPDALDFTADFLPPEQLIIALGAAMIVGILAGLAPAIRAAKLNTVDALRYE